MLPFLVWEYGNMEVWKYGSEVYKYISMRRSFNREITIENN